MAVGSNAPPQTQKPYRCELHALRLKRGVSQEDVAQVLTCSQRRYSQYERNEVDMPLKKIWRALDYFACSFEDLIVKTP